MKNEQKTSAGISEEEPIGPINIRRDIHLFRHQGKQIETIYYLIPIQLAKILKYENTKCWRGNRSTGGSLLMEL